MDFGWEVGGGGGLGILATRLICDRVYERNDGGMSESIDCKSERYMRRKVKMIKKYRTEKQMFGSAWDSPKCAANQSPCSMQELKLSALHQLHSMIPQSSQSTTHFQSFSNQPPNYLHHDALSLLPPSHAPNSPPLLPPCILHSLQRSHSPRLFPRRRPARYLVNNRTSLGHSNDERSATAQGCTECLCYERNAGQHDGDQIGHTAGERREG